LGRSLGEVTYLKVSGRREEIRYYFTYFILYNYSTYS